MPRLSVFFIRTALLHLALGFTIGGLLLFNKGVPLTPQLWRLLPWHIELVLVGWTLQLALGVAFWILPRFRVAPVRGAEWPIWVAYGLLNLGVLSILLSPWVPAWAGRLIFLGRSAELVAVALFAFNTWPRVKALGQ